MEYGIGQIPQLVNNKETNNDPAQKNNKQNQQPKGKFELHSTQLEMKAVTPPLALKENHPQPGTSKDRKNDDMRNVQQRCGQDMKFPTAV